jgi:hypothetical protein
MEIPIVTQIIATFPLKQLTNIAIAPHNNIHIVSPMMNGYKTGHNSWISLFGKNAPNIKKKELIKMIKKLTPKKHIILLRTIFLRAIGLDIIINSVPSSIESRKIVTHIVAQNIAVINNEKDCISINLFCQTNKYEYPKIHGTNKIIIATYNHNNDPVTHVVFFLKAILNKNFKYANILHCINRAFNN